MPIHPTIACQFTCKSCGITNKVVHVRARLSEKEVITEWIKEVQIAVANSHRQSSPNCKVTTISELKIPTYEGLCIGAPKPEV